MKPLSAREGFFLVLIAMLVLAVLSMSSPVKAFVQENTRPRMTKVVAGMLFVHVGDDVWRRME